MSTPPGPTDAVSSTTPEQWTIRRLLQWIAGALAEREVDSPRVMADLLLTHTLGCERMHLYTHSDAVPTPEQLGELRALVRRALMHEPIQYLVGEAWFLGLRLGVDRRVLIPRPATEVLVEELLQDARRRGLLAERPRERVAVAERAMLRDYAKARAEAGLDENVAPEVGGHEANGQAADTPGPLLVADIGTGSGAIALAVLHTAANARVLATDISEEALAVAETNAQSLGLGKRLTLLSGDLAAPVRGWLEAEHPGAAGLDYLVSNPPYIPDYEWETPGQVDANVKGHEPEGALRGGPDGLRFVEPLIEAAPSLLKEGGAVLIEIASATADAAVARAERAGLREVRMVKDLDGLPRVLVARR